MQPLPRARAHLPLLQELRESGSTFTPPPWHWGKPAERETLRPQELRCEEQLAVIDCGSQRSSSLVLHPSLPIFVNAAAREDICVWDFVRRSRQNGFANGNPAGSRCTSSLLIGQESQFLVIGSSEGAVRIWRNWEFQGEQQLINSFNVVGTSDGGARDPWSHGLSLAWQPQLTRLTVSRSGSPWLSSWDLHHERCTFQLLVGAEDGPHVTSIW